MPVPEALRPWVADIRIRSLRADRDRAVSHLPDTAPALVFCPTSGTARGLLVMGPRTRASYYRAKDVPFSVALRLHPGRARALLGLPLPEVVDRVVPLGDLWGAVGARLAGQLIDLADDPERALDRIRAAVLAHAGTRSDREVSRADLVRAATELVGRADRVPVAARRLSVSERHLRALFTESVGLSPKHFARIDRVRTVLARAGQARWATLAAEVGYYDQSHLTAEFRATMGVPPAAFLAGRLPELDAC